MTFMMKQRSGDTRSVLVIYRLVRHSDVGTGIGHAGTWQLRDPMVFALLNRHMDVDNKECLPVTCSTVNCAFDQVTPHADWVEEHDDPDIHRQWLRQNQLATDLRVGLPKQRPECI
jgi:hypothetical protein